MTAKEALHEISTKVFRNTDDCEMRVSKECYKTILQSLQKQIPKKPTKIDEEYLVGSGEWKTDWECSVCGNPRADDSYCSCCGQALDWSDTE